MSQQADCMNLDKPQTARKEQTGVLVTEIVHRQSAKTLEALPAMSKFKCPNDTTEIFTVFH